MDNPTVADIHTFCAATGFSADYLIGADDVPKLRAERSQLGELGAALRDLMQGPDGAPPLPNLGASELAEHIRAVYWSARRERLAKSVQGLLFELAARVEELERELRTPRDQASARNAALIIRFQAERFGPGNASWSDLTRFLAPVPVKRPVPGEVLTTPFPAVGGVGFLLSSDDERSDIAVVIESRQGSGASSDESFGRVAVRRSHANSRRFLQRTATPRTLGEFLDGTLNPNET